MIAKEIAPGCYQQEVISDTVLDNIEKSDDNRKAQELLFHHLDDCGTVHALKILCDEINLDGGDEGYAGTRLDLCRYVYVEFQDEC